MSDIRTLKKHPSYILPIVTANQHATILAALRVYQAVRDREDSPDVSDILSGFVHLSDCQIDVLIERLNKQTGTTGPRA